MAHGRDDRPVDPHQERKSIGCEETYARDLTDIDAIRKEVAALAEHCAGALTRRKLLARTVTLKLRYSNFETITRSETRKPPTDSPKEIVARAVALVEKTEAGRRPVRLLGVSMNGLEDATGVEDRNSAPALFAPSPPER